MISLPHLAHCAGLVRTAGPLAAPVLRPPEAQAPAKYVHTASLRPALQPGLTVPVLPAVPLARTAGRLPLTAVVTTPTHHGEGPGSLRGHEHPDTRVWPTVLQKGQLNIIKDIIVIRFCWNSYISYEFQVKFV